MNGRKRTAQNDRPSHPPTPSCQDSLGWGTLRGFWQAAENYCDTTGEHSRRMLKKSVQQGRSR